MVSAPLCKYKIVVDLYLHETNTHHPSITALKRGAILRLEKVSFVEVHKIYSFCVKKNGACIKDHRDFFHIVIIFMNITFSLKQGSFFLSKM